MDNPPVDPTKSQNNTDDEKIESLRGKPSRISPEGAATRELFHSEAEPSYETAPTPEKEKIPEFPSLEEQAQQEETTKAPLEPAQETEEIPHVVDKTDTLTDMHHIKEPGDKLTPKADEEEQDFIEEVEKHHGLL